LQDTKEKQKAEAEEESYVVALSEYFPLPGPGKEKQKAEAGEETYDIVALSEYFPASGSWRRFLFLSFRAGSVLMLQH
jgi:hypothetical protein